VGIAEPAARRDLRAWREWLGLRVIGLQKRKKPRGEMQRGFGGGTELPARSYRGVASRCWGKVGLGVRRGGRRESWLNSLSGLGTSRD